ncbi:MAG: hypothetical protein WDM71_11905 [Ferruginibacter sp.]
MQKFLSQQNDTGEKQNPEKLLLDVAQSSIQNQRIVVKIGSKIKIIPVKDVWYLEAADDL